MTSSHSVDLDRLPFYGLKAPIELKQLKKLLLNFEPGKFAVFLKDFCNGVDALKIFDKFTNDDIDKQTIAQIAGGLHQLYLLAIRQPRVVFKLEHFRRDLEDLGINAECVALLSEAFANVSSRRKIEMLYTLSPALPTITSIKWRVDISISSPEQVKLLVPLVTLHLSFSNNETYAIQFDIKSFHKLRLSIAQMLQEMQLLEKRPVLKPFVTAA